jgi:hypothetical protein
LEKLPCSSVIINGNISPVIPKYFIEKGIENIAFPCLRSESANYNEKSGEVKKKQIS